jgi:hypothetical protein
LIINNFYKYMNIKIYQKILIGVMFGILIITSGAEVSHAATATFTGSIDDDGGDPNLTVWFKYGPSASYGYETTHQSKTGTGDFTATASGLQACTTYHYQAVSKHQNFNDTMYGQDKTFTTECDVTTDLKANNSDGPITVAYQNRNSLSLSWTSQNATSCTATSTDNVWTGSKSTSGSQTISLSDVKTYTFTLTCVNSAGGSPVSDSVQVVLQAPTAPTVVTKGVVVTY